MSCFSAQQQSKSIKDKESSSTSSSSLSTHPSSNITSSSWKLLKSLLGSKQDSSSKAVQYQNRSYCNKTYHISSDAEGPNVSGDSIKVEEDGSSDEEEDKKKTKTTTTKKKKQMSECAPETPLFPLPLPPPQARMDGTYTCLRVREFSFDELAGACLNFAPEFFVRDGGAGPVYRAFIGKNSSSECDQEQEHEIESNATTTTTNTSNNNTTTEVEVTRLNGQRPSQSFKKWKAEVNTLFRLSHPHVCKVLGFSGDNVPCTPQEEGNCLKRDRLLVYEHMPNGNLESLLYCRKKNKAPLEWKTRLKIAFDAARGLAFLHARPVTKQILFKSFKTINIQVDQDFNAKLSDYGFPVISRNDPYAAPETRTSDIVTAKSNVWSFGIVLLELLTGRQNMDDLFPQEERNLLQWCRPYLLDPKRLYLVMDPELKGRYPTQSAKIVADLALQCLSVDPEKRPTMMEVVMKLSSPFMSASNLKVEHHGMNNVMRLMATEAMMLSKSHRVHGFKDGNHNHSLYGSNFKSYSLASMLASPARSFVASTSKFRGLISGEDHKDHSASVSQNSFLSRCEFLSGEIGLQDPRPHGQNSHELGFRF